MAKDSIKNIVLFLMYLVTTFDIPSIIQDNLSSDAAGFLKLYCILIRKHYS